MYKTDHYENRYFNSIKDNGITLTKFSKDIKKIESEYAFYYFIPENIQRWFVQPFNFEIKNEIASYQMEKIFCKNAGEILASFEMDLISFKNMFKLIAEFKKECKEMYYSEDNCKEESKYLVITKTQNRIQENYSDIMLRISKAYDFYKQERLSWMKTLSHGDLCLTNILWSKDINLIKFIDPRGAFLRNDIYMDEYYDLAKLSHSILGGYENILYGHHFSDQAMKDIFINYLHENNISVNLLRVYEASLFLSMVPLHKDNKEHVDLFINKSKEILNELGF